MKPLRPAFVVTVSTLACAAAACENTPPAQEPVATHNPPGVETAPPTVTSNPPPPPLNPPRIIVNPPPPVRTPPLPATGVLNPRDAEGRQIYVREDGACYVHLPFDGGPQTSWQPPKTKDVSCPGTALDPAFRACAYGTVSADSATSTECECHVDGNPPPPPKKVACPKR